jgi:hypothetical protein
MPIGTDKSNADSHPGHIVLEYQQTRWSQKQIEDVECASAKANQAKEEASAKCHTVLTHIAKPQASTE